MYSTTNVIIGISVGVFVRGWTLTDGTRIFEIKLSFTFAEKKDVWKECPRDNGQSPGGDGGQGRCKKGGGAAFTGGEGGRQR